MAVPHDLRASWTGVRYREGAIVAVRSDPILRVTRIHLARSTKPAGDGGGALVAQTTTCA